MKKKILVNNFELGVPNGINFETIVISKWAITEKNKRKKIKKIKWISKYFFTHQRAEMKMARSSGIIYHHIISVLVYK